MNNNDNKQNLNNKINNCAVITAKLLQDFTQFAWQIHSGTVALLSAI